MNAKRVSLVAAAPLLFLLACSGGSGETALLGEDSGASTGDPIPGSGDDGGIKDDPGTDTDASTGTAASTGTGGGTGGGSAGEPAELAGITDAHNTARAAENAGLPALTWDPALAAIAKAWGSQCKSDDGALIDHNAGRSNGYPTYVGENIYASSGSANGPGAVSSWISEKKNYNYAKNSCSGVCGHYTQVVWKSTTKLGCALVNCPNLRYPSTIICDYGPGGNMSGERPY